jgi:biotin carboxylase
VKPVALSGSRGVIRADDRDAFVAAFERVRAILRCADVVAERNEAHASVLVEEFVPGSEYAVEGLLHHGLLKVLAIFDKPDPLDGPYFEETIYLAPSSAPAALQEQIVEAVGGAARALGLHHGPIHAECRINNMGVFVLEVAARPIGGLCARALRFGGRPLEEMLLRHALGEDPCDWRLDPEASGVMMIPIPRRGVLRGVSGIDAAMAIPHVTDLRVTAKMDQLLVPLPEGASYLGFIFARASEPAEVDRALRAAHDRLVLRIDPEFTVIPPREIRYNLTHG